MLFETRLVYLGVYHTPTCRWQTYPSCGIHEPGRKPDQGQITNVSVRELRLVHAWKSFPGTSLIHGPSVPAMHGATVLLAEYRGYETISHQPNRDLLQIAMQRETIFAAHLASRIPTSSSTVVRWWWL